MAATVEGLKAYLRFPPEDVTVFLLAAKSKARTAGIPDFQNNAQYDLFVYTLAGMYYDRRGGAPDEGAIRDVVNSFVPELRYAKEDDAEEG